ncbi:MAG: monomeric [FeFe] hydrogenase [Planctomycetia bacterium]|nr:monomeric [FeFe] hydrogenase [Planctomycetia bacterium]
MRNGAQFIRREVMIRLVRAFDEGNLVSEIDKIPILLRPKHGETSRCCLYHDRAVLKYRLMALLGFACEDETDETRTLASYVEEALKTEPTDGAIPLTVCSAGCSSCPDSSFKVTDTCRGCFARPCVYNCPKKAISVVNQQSQIDYSKCIKCGKCMAVCPFNAIVKTTVPCEEVCPVGAIRKDEHGTAQINFDRCIACGKCFNACPFGAIMERSQLLKVLQAIQDPETEVVAMIAPSAYAQFPGSVEQLFSAVSKLGFNDVMEVALGAEMTTAHEAQEFIEKMEEGQPIMTTSCCPAYTGLVHKHLPAFEDKVSSTPSPMVYAARLVREKHPNAKTVFVGPCIAKRFEASHIPEVDYVLTFEEIGVMMAARRIDIISQEPWALTHPANEHARNFAKSCGVTQAVLAELAPEHPNIQVNGKFIDGIDKKTLAMLRAYASGKLPANFLEVMACPGGCVSGPCSLTK